MLTHMLNRILCLFSGLPSHRGLSEHPHSRLSVPAGAHQTETLGTVGANSRCVSATSMKNETCILCSSLSTEVILVAFRAEEVPENILEATADLKTVNIIPAIGKLTLRCDLTNCYCCSCCRSSSISLCCTATLHLIQ